MLTPGARDDITAEIDRIVQRFLPANHGDEQLSADDSLADSGLNSVSLLEIIVALEDRFGIELTTEPEVLTGLDSRSALHKLVMHKVFGR